LQLKDIYIKNIVQGCLVDCRELFFKEIRARFYKKNKNWLCAFCGETGSGKTYGAIELARNLNRRFDIEKHIVFTVEHFMTLLNSKTLKRGDIIIFEEAGVGMSSKEWYSQSNKLFSYVLQTFRHLGMGVIFTMPSLNLLDKTARTLLHHYFETFDIDFDKKIARVKVFLFQYNILMDKLYKKHPVYKDEDGVEISLPMIGFEMPPTEMLELYEEQKTNFTTTLNESIMTDLNAQKEAKKPKKGCIKCGSSDIRHSSKEKCWICKKCGHIHLSNPFD